MLCGVQDKMVTEGVGRMRLTEVKKNGEWALKGVKWKKLCTGKKITLKVREKLYGALCKLRDYENTGLSPEEVERVNDFSESQVARLMKELQNEREKYRWIPVTERLPEKDRWVQVSVRRHHWISDFDNNKISDEEKIYYPEEIYYTLGQYSHRIGCMDVWELFGLESLDEYPLIIFTNDCRVEDLSYPKIEVIAWKSMPELYKEGADARN